MLYNTMKVIFSLVRKRSPGWSLFLAPFMSVVNSNDFLDYSNLARVLSHNNFYQSLYFQCIVLARKFFNEKYSVVAASLFAFEPHLNYSSGICIIRTIIDFSSYYNNGLYTYITKQNTSVLPLFLLGFVGG